MPLDDRFVWLITGSSRGLGRAFAEGILERGDIVVATARKPRELESLPINMRKGYFLSHSM
jgi:NAD(P)-dependent dehydrogenase (short-subunit alcohol dehydrogenase family)